MAMIASGGGGGPTPKPKPTPISRGVAAIVAPVAQAAHAISHVMPPAPTASRALPPAPRRAVPPRDSSSGRFVRPAQVSAPSPYGQPKQTVPDSLIRNPIFQAINKIRNPTYSGTYDLGEAIRELLGASQASSPGFAQATPQGGMALPLTGPDRMPERAWTHGSGTVPIPFAAKPMSQGFAKRLQRAQGLHSEVPIPRRFLT